MVSVSTVSKALNDSSEISEKTKKRVKELADFYGYVPNHIAVSLKNQSTFNIGVIIPNIQNPFFADVLKSIEINAKKEGFRIITFFTGEKLQEEIESLKILANGMVEGIIICPSEETSYERKFKHFQRIAETTPLVTFDRIDKELNFNSVSVDDDQSILQACNIFKQNKAKHLLFVSSIGRHSVGKTRRRTFTSFLKEVKNMDGVVLEENDFTKLQKTMEKHLLESPQKIDAVLGADIESTLIAHSIIMRHQLSYINEISLIGYVNKKQNELQYPRISYINQFPEKIGKQAVDILIRNLKTNPSNPIKEIIKTKVVTQDTSK